MPVRNCLFLSAGPCYPSRTSYMSRRAILILLLSLFASFSTACLRVIRHDEDLAATGAVNFVRAAIIERDYLSAYQQLSQKAQAESSATSLRDMINRMHPRNWPQSIVATEFEPLPSQRAMQIFLFAKEDGEDFTYRLLMELTADTGYKVSSISRLQGALPLSSIRKPLPIQRTTR